MKSYRHIILVVVAFALGGCMAAMVEPRPVLTSLPEVIVVSQDFVSENIRNRGWMMHVTPGEYRLASRENKLVYYQCADRKFRCVHGRGEEWLNGGIGYSLVNGRFFTFTIRTGSGEYINMGTFSVMTPSGTMPPMDWGLVPDEAIASWSTEMQNAQPGATDNPGNAQ